MKTCGVGYTFLGDREFDSLRSLLRLDDVETKKISFGGEVTFANPRISFEIQNGLLHFVCDLDES